MPHLDSNDPIVKLAGRINEQIPDDADGATVVAALAAVLGACLDMAIEDGVAPPEFADLRGMLMFVTSEIVRARTAFAMTES